MKSGAIATLFVGPQGLRAGWGLLLFGVTLVVFYVGFLLIVPYGYSGELGLFLTEATLLVAVFACTALMAWLEGRHVWSYGLSEPRALPRVLWGAFWGVALLTLLIGALYASEHIEIGPAGLLAPDAIAYGLAYAAGLLVVALAEETLFRGYLQVTLARLVGFWPAAGLLSLAFGAVHQGNPGESPLGVGAAVLIGAVLCLCLRLSGSLWWGIGFHAAWDWAQSFLWGTPVSGFVLEGRWLQSDALGAPLWSGGDTGPEGSLLVLPVLALTVLVIVRSFLRTGAAASA